MQKVQVIFVDAHNIVGRVVQQVTNSQWSHVGIIIPSMGLVEAVFPRVTVSPIDRYNGIYTQIVELEVTDEQYAAMEAAAVELLGKFYGFDDCVVGGIHDKFGDQASNRVGEIIEFDNAIDCSATVTTILRAAGIDLFPGDIAAEITPEAVYAALMTIFYNS